MDIEISSHHRRALGGLAVLILLIGGYALATGSSGPSQEAIDEFAQCLTDEGATFYGAYWCRHCNEQKSMFGDAMSSVDYVECSPNGQEAPQAQECQDQGISGYPTWIVDGERYSGVQSFDQLADATGCAPPRDRME